MSPAAAALPLGSRVVVRARLDPPPQPGSGGPSMTDAVGTLVAMDDARLVIETDRGTVTIARHLVVAAKVVPPKPARRGAPHLALSMADLQHVMVDSWPPVERQPLGDWLLRASGGFTNRGNSVMTAGSPGQPLDAAVDEVERWYAARGLPAILALFGPEGFAADDDDLGAELLRRGYVRHSSALVMTGDVQAVAQTAPPTSVRITNALEPQWLSAYERQRTITHGPTEAVLTGSPEQWFASVRADDGSEIVAVARMAVANGWAGLGGVWVDPGRRRRGLAKRLTAALARKAASRRIRSMHLQVEDDNAPAIALYEGLGFQTHHQYIYLRKT